MVVMLTSKIKDETSLGVGIALTNKVKHLLKLCHVSFILDRTFMI